MWLRAQCIGIRATGLFLLQATYPTATYLWSSQFAGCVSEVLTGWLPVEQCVYAKWQSLPFLQTDVPSEWALGWVSEVPVGSPPPGHSPR